MSAIAGAIAKALGEAGIQFLLAIIQKWWDIEQAKRGERQKIVLDQLNFDIEVLNEKVRVLSSADRDRLGSPPVRIGAGQIQLPGIDPGAPGHP